MDLRILEFQNRGKLCPTRDLIKNQEQIEGIRRAGALNTAVLDEVANRIREGMSTEEINRIVCDQLSSILFTPTATGLHNLTQEGFAEDGIKQLVRFANQKGQRVVLSGDVMFDNSLYFSEMAERKSDIIERLW